jgi:holo-[acyl-carrier protein] synthase
MILGTGIDLAEVDRIAAAVSRYGPRFVERVFTPAEIAYAESKANRFERFAARFAAKEAGMKAIGTGWRRGVGWHDFEVVREPGGRPTLAFHGRAAEFAARLGVKRVSLSLTHTHIYGMAFVILEGDPAAAPPSSTLPRPE